MPEKSGQTWLTWLVLGGRGAGKTRTGAEWVRQLAKSNKPQRIALVGVSLNDVRSVMIEGESGLLAVHPALEMPVFEPSKRRVVWPGGAVAQMFSAENPDGLRGPQFTAAWCDELCKWSHATQTWDMLQFALRLGAAPRQIVTTTPRPIPLLKRLMADPRTVMVRASTHQNAANLAPNFLRTVVETYGATRLGRQEIDAEILEDNPQALWSRSAIDAHRVGAAPPLQRIVVAVDPPVTTSKSADACGILVAGIGENGHAYVLEDATLQGIRPVVWAKRAVRAYHTHQADRLIVEVNQGGDLVGMLIGDVDAAVAVRNVRATRAKWLRAEPVAALYEQGRVHHVGAWPALEDEMCLFTPSGFTGAKSPDRVDALVWALTELMLGRGGPQVRSL
ncbi:MAG: DNA-packaging protein [Alphaproteobacteria bacterium]